MNDTQYYLTMAITGVGTFVLAAIGFIVAFNNRVTEAYNMAKSAHEQATENKNAVGLLAAKIELLSRDSHNMEVELSNKISSLTVMVENTNKTMHGIERTMHDLSNTTMKILGELARSNPPR